MHPISLKYRLLSAVALITLISACGGGGGGGGGGKGGPSRSYNELTSQFNQLRQQAYQGIETPADLSEDAIVPLARMHMSGALPIENTPLAAPSTRKATFRLTSIGADSVKTVVSHLRKARSATPSAQTRDRIDEREACSNEDGYIDAKGEWSQAGETYNINVDLNYHNCVMQDGSTSNGKAIYLRGAEATGEEYFYDGLKISMGALSRTLTGSIQHRTDGHTITNLTVKDELSGLTFQYVNVDESSHGIDGYSTGHNASGRFYHPAFGYIDLSADYNTKDFDKASNGTLQMTGRNNEKALLTFSDMVARIDLSPTMSGYVSLPTLFESGPYSKIAFTSPEDLGAPPKIGTLHFTGNKNSYSNGDEIEVDLGEVTDPDNDSVSVSYRWSVNGSTLADVTSETFPAGILHKGDFLYVTAVITSGISTLDSNSLYLVADDAAPTVISTDIPEEATVGSPITFNTKFADPDGIDQLSPLTSLVYGPMGASLSANGVVSWTPAPPLFGKESTVHFGFQDALHQYAVKDFAIKVKDANAQDPITRAIFDVDDYNGLARSIRTAQLDTDNDKELVVIRGNTLYSLKRNGSQWFQSQVYPYLITIGHELISAEPHDFDGDGKDEILVAATDGLYQFTDLLTSPVQILKASGYTISSFVLQDIDGDNFPEAVLLTRTTPEYYGGNTEQKIQVIDLRTGVPAKSITLTEETTTLRVANVDNDTQKEFLLDTGYIYDSKTGSVDWHYEDRFPNDFITADISGNGVDRVLFIGSGGNLRIGNAITHSVTDTTVNDVLSMQAMNLDSDRAQELVVRVYGNYETGNLKVLDLSGTTTVEQWAKFITNNTLERDAMLIAAIDEDGMPALIQSNIDHHGVEVIGLNSNDSYHGTEAPDGLSVVSLMGHHETNEGATCGDFASDTKAFRLCDNNEFTIAIDSIAAQDYSSFLLTDYNHDNVSEVFATDYGNKKFSLLQASDFTALWNLNKDYEVYDHIHSKIVSRDINHDAIDEAIIGYQNDSVDIIDVAHQTVLWSHPMLSYWLPDFAVGDMDGDGEDEIVIAADHELSIWKKSGSTYEKTNSVNEDCNRLEIADVLGDASPEIICGKQNYSYGDYSFTFYSNQLDYKNSFHPTYRWSEFAVAHHPGAKATLLLSVTDEARLWDDTSANYSFISEIAPESGAIIWESNRILGEVAHNNMQLFKDSNNKQRLAFTTGNAAYLTR